MCDSMWTCLILCNSADDFDLRQEPRVSWFLVGLSRLLYHLSPLCLLADNCISSASAAAFASRAKRSGEFFFLIVFGLEVQSSVKGEIIVYLSFTSLHLDKHSIHHDSVAIDNTSWLARHEHVSPTHSFFFLWFSRMWVVGSAC